MPTKIEGIFRRSAPAARWASTFAMQALHQKREGLSSSTSLKHRMKLLQCLAADAMPSASTAQSPHPDLAIAYAPRKQTTDGPRSNLPEPKAYGRSADHGESLLRPRIRSRQSPTATHKRAAKHCNNFIRCRSDSGVSSGACAALSTVSGTCTALSPSHYETADTCGNQE